MKSNQGAVSPGTSGAQFGSTDSPSGITSPGTLKLVFSGPPGRPQCRAIAGRVYHEAYEGSWVGYNYAARSKGITGYQFRAPAEWFAELYAAYYSGK